MNSQITYAKRVGIIHSIVQVILAIIITEGAAFLFPLALSESPGQFGFVLWLLFNFLVVPVVLIRTIEKQIKNTAIQMLLKLTLVPLLAGLVALLLYILFYKYHFFYTKNQFKLDSISYGFVSIVLFTSGSVLIAELMRKFIIEKHFR